MTHCTEPTAGGPCMLPLDADGRCSIQGHNSRFLTIEELIERSSLGTPGAKARRERTPPEVVDRIMRKAGYEPTDPGSQGASA